MIGIPREKHELACPNCGTPFGGAPDDVEVDARGFCPRCKWNLVWNGMQWIKGRRDFAWWRRQ